MATQQTFRSFEFDNGVLESLRGDPFPTELCAWSGGEVVLEDGATHFGWVFEGEATLVRGQKEFPLYEGMYFSLAEGGSIRGDGRGFVVSRIDYRGFFHLGGPIEATGRLRYIDGCTDSLLIPPVIQGDPCFNQLHIPAHTAQTQHTHPSIRVGIITSGCGYCVTPGKNTPLYPGLMFIIYTDCMHSFHTADSDLSVVVYHPDSDFGPTHQDHPMINRTIIDERISV